MINLILLFFYFYFFRSLKKKVSLIDKNDKIIKINYFFVYNMEFILKYKILFKIFKIYVQSLGVG